MPPRYVPFALAACLLQAPAIFAQGAHEHGVARLQIAVEGDTLQASFDLPGHDLLGFEHAPSSDAERAALASAGARLQDAAAILRLSPEAQCSVAEASFESETATAGEAHVDFVARYRFTCATPAALTGFTTGIFRAFPSLGALAVQSQTPQGAREQRIVPDQPDYRF